MVQKEMAERLSAKVSTKDYNAFSIMVQYYADVRIVLNVPRTCFTPSPNVDSAVVEIKRINRTQKPQNEELFKNTVSQSFKERRKTLINNLSSFLNKEKLKFVFEELGFDENIRAENLSIDDFIALSDKLGDHYA